VRPPAQNIAKKAGPKLRVNGESIADLLAKRALKQETQ
jgi:hypothetical protein